MWNQMFRRLFLLEKAYITNLRTLQQLCFCVSHAQNA